MRAPRPVGAPALRWVVALVLLAPSLASSRGVVLESSPTPDALLGRPPAALGPGVYVLPYRALAVDGHITEGALRFTVDARR